MTSSQQKKMMETEEQQDTEDTTNDDGKNDKGTSAEERFRQEQRQRLKPTTLEAKIREWLSETWQSLLQRMGQQNSSMNPHYVYAALVVVLAMIVSPPGRALSQWMLRQLYKLFLTIIGTALGVGLGLGLASHVYDQLDVWEERQQRKKESSGTKNTKGSAFRTTTTISARSGLTGVAPQLLSKRTISAVEDAAVSMLEDEQSYTSLMVSAGYHTDRFSSSSSSNHANNNNNELPFSTLRGQVLRKDQIPNPRYMFTKNVDNDNWKAVLAMRTLWPNLPLPIQNKLGQAIEYILRDFVGCWYYKADGGCPNPYTAETTAPPSSPVVEAAAKEGSSSSSSQQHQRVMMYSLAVHRSLPFMDALYESCAIVFGNLATRVEHVNVMELLLLKWVKVLAHTFKWYRILRKNVQNKQLAHHTSGNNQQHQQRRSRRGGVARNNVSENTTTGAENNSNRADVARNVPVSEMAMTKEFLFAGKLHRAVTFGLDVPSLLFADSNGKECGKPQKNSDGTIRTETVEDRTTARDKNNSADDEVLEARLFDTDLIAQCELDYNRVVGHRMVRALVARADYGSSIVASLLTEIMGGCVLTPIMSLFCPYYLNSWMITGLTKSPDEDTEQGGGSESEPQGNNAGEDAGQSGRGVEIVLDDVAMENKAEAEASRNEMAASASDEPAALHEHKTDTTVSPVELQATAALEKTNTSGEGIPSMLTLAIIDLQNFVDFEEYRIARVSNQELNVDWDDPQCRAAVLKLVLVIEAALTHGRCKYRPKVSDEIAATDSIDGGLSADGDSSDGPDSSDRPIEISLSDYESTSLTQTLMELTSDIEAFEERVAIENARMAERDSNKFDDMVAEPYQPTAAEQSTLRTLIAAWLHMGQVYRTISLLIQAHATVLAPYYHKTAFLRSRENATGFARQLRALMGVNMMVDTTIVLSSPRLDELSNGDISSFVEKNAHGASPRQRVLQEDDNNRPTSILSASMLSASSVPRYLDFQRNESFAASLRAERERRMQSWERMSSENVEDGFPVVVHSRGATDEDFVLHKELHHIARIFFAGTNLLALRDAARRRSVEGGGDTHSAADSAVDGVQVSLMTVETACPRRRIEVPDDDSSFLLRAQPRPLNAVGVHRDQRNHDQSFKCFAGTYEEPALPVGSDHFTGGRLIRRCLIRYYPIDRTASVALQNDFRKLDQRKSKNTVPDTITLQTSRPAPFLSAEFLNERHLCQRWVPKGTTRSQSLLASSVMEPSDFTSSPRAGKAIDFVYRLNFYERPMLDLGGKHFTVHDATALGAHRADASALELSDASLSVALLILGSSNYNCANDSSATQHQGVEMGKDGYPVIWMKFSRKQDDTHVEVKPYRTSFVRAALMITAARQEAQLRCLVKCVKAGSAKKATKALTDLDLRATQKLVEYAGSPNRGKQSILMRDLKLGVNHIDRGQLRRNALLSPRYPTELLQLSATVEDASQETDAKPVDLFGSGSTVFKIKCAAVVSLVAPEMEMNGDVSYKTEDGSIAATYKEEWVVYRSMKEFQSLHKHLKLQVSTAESSGTAGSRLVGAATAAFAATSAMQGRSRQRKVLLPSLAQVSKVGALGATQKLLLKRKETLDGYLSYLLSPGHLLSNCSELLLFLGASFPLDPAVRVGSLVQDTADPLGRKQMSRVILQQRHEPFSVGESSVPALPSQKRTIRSTSVNSAMSMDDEDDDFMDDEDDDDQFQKYGRKINMNPAVRSKIERVKLAQVRKGVFELLRYQFGFENASFARNRLLAALKTASLAVTSAAEFRKMLYKLHVEHVNADAIAGWVSFLIDTLWPNGVFFESSPPLTEEELKEQAEKAKELLYGSFPDQVRAILGNELTKDGVYILHEMLQNRMVVKSMAYMLFDLLWLDVFPEIGDVLPCGAAILDANDHMN